MFMEPSTVPTEDGETGEILDVVSWALGVLGDWLSGGHYRGSPACGLSLTSPRLLAVDESSLSTSRGERGE
jgi:hypothetical protein